jgi:hypothetical protein
LSGKARRAIRSIGEMTPIDHVPNRPTTRALVGQAIIGTTRSGKPFRPGDWAERLAGVIALFVKERRPGGSVASTWLAVPFVYGGVKCLGVSAELADICPEAFEFVMRFAADNDLAVEARQ